MGRRERHEAEIESEPEIFAGVDMTQLVRCMRW